MGMTPEAEFRQALRQAMTRKGITRRAISGALGFSESSVDRWLRRDKPLMPRHASVVALAEFMGSERLVELSLASRTSDCVICGRSGVNAGRGVGPKLYCTKRCADLARMRRDRGSTVDRYRLLNRSAKRMREAVDAFCRECTGGEMLCRDDECLLRPVSPLPFVAMRGLDGRRVA